ncbi:hypothetical protein COB72_04085 [bacterium]|nr:MAG: hypothetical protein COB72_04085 [bacterium]
MSPIPALSSRRSDQSRAPDGSKQAPRRILSYMTLPKRKILIPFIAAIALISAFTWKHYQNVNRYVSRGKFPDITLLMRASSEGDIEQVQSLLDRGADITLTNGFGGTALGFAIGNAINSKNHDIVKLLLESGADINDHYPEGYNDLHYCTLSAAVPYSTSSPEDIDLFSYLANLNPHDVSNHYCQIAGIAARFGNPTTLELFLSSIDPDSASMEARIIASPYSWREKFKALDPDIQQQINDILNKYE